jgi:acetyltransferase
MFDIGNGSDIGWADILEYLENDPETKVIFLYTEGIPHGKRFLDIARRVTQKKPIVAIKTGMSEAAKKAVASHTGSLAGEDAIYEAAFRQAGIIRAEGLEEFHDIAKALLFLHPMKGKRVGIVTTTGAGGIMATDACDAVNLEMAPLSEKTRRKLEAVYPLWMSVDNPCDIWPAASIMRHGLDNVYAMTLKALIEDETVDAVACLCIAVNYGWGHFNIPGVVRSVAENSQKPIIAWFFGPDMDEERAKVEKGGNVVAYPTVDRGMRALAALHAHTVNIQGEFREYEQAVIENERVKTLFSRARENNSLNLGLEALDVLGACAITIPTYGIAETESEAVALAEDIGYPIVMKVLAEDLLHKTEVGGVLTGIDSSSSVSSAYQRIGENLQKAGLSGSTSKVIVQKMIDGGKEVIIGMKRDQHFGPVIMFGMGGIYAEVLKDVSFRIAPLSREDAQEMIAEVKGYDLLKGVRGEEPSDISAIADTLLKVSQLAIEFPETMEMDINPFIVLAEGKGGVGADARMRLDS